MVAKQRIAIAERFPPRILLCDEPTGSLDTKTGQQIIETFQSLNAAGYRGHDHPRERVSEAASRVIQIEDGRIVDSGDREMSSAHSRR